MASNPKRPRFDTQSYMSQGQKSSPMSNATCWDYTGSDSLDNSDCRGPNRSFHSRETAEDILNRNFQDYTPFSGSRASSLSPCAIPDRPFNNSDLSNPSIWNTQDYIAFSSTEKVPRTGTEGYLMQAGQYPHMAEDQSWKQNLGYHGQEQRFQESYHYSSQPTQSGSHAPNFQNTFHPQYYSSNYAPSSYVDYNRMPSMASPDRSSYPPLRMPVAQPSIVVEEAQDDPARVQRDDQSSLYQDCLGTNVSLASRRGVCVGLNGQRSSTRSLSRNHRTHDDMTDLSDLEESAEGKLTVPRAPRRRQREDDSQRRRRHLTPEGREHAKEVRKVHACKDCRRRKIKCKHVLERDLVSSPSLPEVQRDALTSPYPFSSAQSIRYPPPLTVQSALFPPAMNGFSYCPSPTPLPTAYNEQTFTDHHRRYQSPERYSM